MTIQDDLLTPEAQGLKKDQTFDRLLACQRIKNPDEADYKEVERAVDILRTINKVRNVQQHPNQRELSNSLTKLGVPYPTPNWGEAWDHIRAKTIEALTAIREKTRMIPD